MKIVVCNAGAWGTAMALHLHRRGAEVWLVPRRAESVAALGSDGENRAYLPGHKLPEGLKVASLDEAILKGAEVALMAAPSFAFAEWAERIRGLRLESAGPRLWVSLAKGLDIATGRTPCEALAARLPGQTVGSLSGPTHAGGLAEGKPAAMTLAAASPSETADRFQEAASGESLRLYRSDDLRGVELGGCLKNVYAIAAGCCQGLELGDNAQAALLTRALAEMARVGQSLGASRETFYGLSGVGDLMATCYGPWSRNRSFGERVARGGRPETIVASQRQAVEGYRTAKAFHALCRKKEVEAPILEQVYGILHAGKPPLSALQDLMRRELKRE